MTGEILLGLAFLIPGANKVWHLLPIPVSAGDATTYLTLLSAHKNLTIVADLEIVSGCLLLAGRYVPLALTLLGPIAVNIFLLHLLSLTGRA